MSASSEPNSRDVCQQLKFCVADSNTRLDSGEGKKKKKTDGEKTVRTGQTGIMTRNIWNIKGEGEILFGRHCVRKAYVRRLLSLRDLEYSFSNPQHTASEFSNTQGRRLAYLISILLFF